jgi:antitoxin (DNA-binding transcriptional repressor) of toxin-antitoxin stability system
VKSVGIREAKAHLSALARAAANGEPTLLTDYGEPRAVMTSIKSDEVGRAVGISDHRNSNNAYWPFRMPLSSTSSSLGYNRRRAILNTWLCPPRARVRHIGRPCAESSRLDDFDPMTRPLAGLRRRVNPCIDCSDERVPGSGEGGEWSECVAIGESDQRAGLGAQRANG